MVDPGTSERQGALNNRAELERRLDERIQTAPENFALVMIDIDGLTDVNDAEGHPAGDMFLDYVHDLMEDLIRHPDRPAEPQATDPDRGVATGTPDELILVHVNGDEYCIILGDTQRQDQVDAFIRRMQTDLSEYGLEASMGGLVHEDGETAQDVYALASQRMEANKKARRLAYARGLSPVIEIALLEAGDRLRVASELLGIAPRRLAAIAVALSQDNPPV